tara:strand:+ start:233 stop:367 length:135 start_codon:yes stop_codon:yes gene_type:complete
MNIEEMMEKIVVTMNILVNTVDEMEHKIERMERLLNLLISEKKE